MGDNTLKKSLTNQQKSDGNGDEQNSGIIIEAGKKNCSVKLLKLYLEKPNRKCDAFFQRPDKELSCAGSWYKNQVL